MVYVLTKILGIDAVKTSVYRNREDAEREIFEWIRMIAPEGLKIKKYERETGEIVYPIMPSSDPMEYIVFILKPCSIK